MIDRQVDKGTKDDDKFFQNWYSKSELLTKTEKCYVAFGHCRKASVGGVTADKAQPITICDNEGKILFCVIHNGTIHNYKELAKKYIPDIDIKDMSDSQVMTQIFYHKGYDVLAEYNGGGAFIIQDYRCNKTFIFRGESLGSLISGTKPSAERPLYCVKTGKSIIFSSIFSVLQGLYWGFEIYDVPSNVLMMCDGNTLYSVKEYDRTKQHSCKLYTATKATGSKTQMRILGEDEDFYGNYYQASYWGAHMVDFDVNTGTYINTATQDELHGIVYISNYGYISNYASGYNKPYYFWNGIMLSGENAYTAIRDLHAAKVPENTLLNIAKRLSCNPVLINKRYCTYDANNARSYYTESYAFPLTNVEIVCNKHGKVVVTYDNTEITAFTPVNLSKEKINNIINYAKNSIR